MCRIPFRSMKFEPGLFNELLLNLQLGRSLLVCGHELLMEFFELAQHLFEFFDLRQNGRAEMICAWPLAKTTAGDDANT